MCIFLSLSSKTHKKVLCELLHTLLGTWKDDFATEIGPLLEPKEGGDNYSPLISGGWLGLGLSHLCNMVLHLDFCGPLKICPSTHSQLGFPEQAWCPGNTKLGKWCLKVDSETDVTSENLTPPSPTFLWALQCWKQPGSAASAFGVIWL